MNKKIIIALIILAVIVGAVIVVWLSGVFAPTSVNQIPAEQRQAEEIIKDMTVDINKDLESVDLGDLDKEFKDVDAELNSL